MAENTRGVFQLIVKSFLSGMRRKTKPILMGEDYYGTKYYEEPPESSGRKTRGRFFEPVNKDDFQQDMPAEWEAWLRYRRTKPPTIEEIETNYRAMSTKKENAAKLKVEYDAKRDKTGLETGIEQHSSRSFPTYKEYEEYNTKNGSGK